jgi:hypothetical protein
MDWVSLRRLNFIFSIILGDRSGGSVSRAILCCLKGELAFDADCHTLQGFTTQGIWGD